MTDPRASIVANINLSKSRVATHSHLVFCCGGEVSTKKSGAASFRQRLVELCSTESCTTPIDMLVAEDFADWLNSKYYRDLMTFEEDLASVVSLVLIVLEAPGAIAELGAFSQTPNLANKLIVIAQSSHLSGKNEKSFINLGILQKLKSAHGNDRVIAYPWTADNIHKLKESTVQNALVHITKYLDTLEKTRKFSRSDTGHLIGLIYTLIDVFLALKEKEILEYFTILDIPLTQAELRRYLYLLTSLNIICKHYFCEQPFYLPAEKQAQSINFSFLQGRPRDERIQEQCMEYYENTESELNRHSTILDYRKSSV